MHTENQVVVYAPPEVVYRLASNVGSWPTLLPHYRYVEVLDERIQPGIPQRRTVRMGATRSGIPVSWTSIQELYPAEHRIRYYHIGGATKGMDVLWSIDSREDGSLVRIIHDLRTPRWWLRPGIVQRLIGDVFVEGIARQTLARIKQHAELQPSEQPAL